jgi:cyclopropane fatty-acyl-phospholipid synthase-like methyltransferase
MDVLRLESLDRRFDAVIDCGLFHVFADEDRARYVAGLAHVTRTGGRLFLLCFSEEEPGTQGPRRVTQEEIRDSFADGWAVEEVRAARYEVRPDLEGISFGEGGPRAWFSVFRREG